MRRTAYIIAFLLGFTEAVFCQSGFEIMSIEYSKQGNVEYVGDDGKKFETPVNRFSAGLSFPVFRKGSFFIINQLRYSRNDVNISSSASIYELVDFSSLGYNIGFFRKKEDISYIGLIAAKYGSTEMSKFQWNRLSYAGSAGFIKTSTNSSLNSWGIFVAGAQDHGETKLIPMLQLQAKFSDNLSFQGLIPVRSKLYYKLSDDVNTGLFQFFHINSFDLTGEFGAEGIEFSRMRNLQLGVFVEKKMTKLIYLNLDSGISCFNKLFVYTPDADLINEYKGNNSYFINLKLFIKIFPNVRH